MARVRQAERKKPIAQESERTGALTRWIGWVAVFAVALLAFVFSFNSIDDFDTWWHLAAGRWIATHGAVPATDTLSHTVRNLPWINVQWGFDLGLYLLHTIGGPVLLSAAGAVIFTTAIILVLRLAARHLDTNIAAALGFLILLVAQERVALRPELLSFVLLASVLAVLDRERSAPSRWLFLLVPLMLIWANVHALFVLGAFAIVCAVIGQAIAQGMAASRRLIVWGGAALAMVFVNPFGLAGALFPLKLLSRIDGSSPVYQTIGEFGSPFAPGAPGLAIVCYKVVLTIGCATGLWALVVGRRRLSRVDWAGLLFFAGLAVVSMSVRRNIAIFAIGAALFIARSVATVVAASPSLRRLVTRAAPAVGVIVILSATALAAAEATGVLTRWDRQPREFGAGVIDGTFPIRAAAFARAAKLPAKLYNDMSAGGYLTWDDPIGDGVFVDARLEVYDTPFLTAFMTAMSNPVLWQRDADRYGIQTAIIGHRFENERLLIGRLIQDKGWTLVYLDEVAAIFVRTQGNDAVLARAAALRPEWDARTAAWLARPVARWSYPAGRVEGTRAYARVLATIGRGEPAVAAYMKFLELGVSASDEIETRLLLARYFTSRGRQPEAREQALRVLAIDPTRTDAMAFVR